VSIEAVYTTSDFPAADPQPAALPRQRDRSTLHQRAISPRLGLGMPLDAGVLAEHNGEKPKKKET
jgi:hypothetical protein